MRTTWGLWGGAAAVALFVAACDGGDSGTTGGTGGTGAAGGSGGSGAGGAQPATCEGQPDVLDVAGTWAAYGVLTASITGKPGSLVSVCPPDQEGQATLLLLVTMEQDSDPKALKNVKASLCAVDLPAVTAVAGTCDPGTEAAVTTQISIPPALLDAFPSLSATAVSGSLAATAPGSDVTLEQFVVTAGASTTGANLPTWNADAPGCDAFDVGHTNQCEMACVSDCSALVDHDSDTFPGISLDVCGRTQDDEGKPCNTTDPAAAGVTIQGRAFAALEVNPQFTGVAKSSCELSGTVASDVRYTVVGADVTLAGTPISVAAALDALPTLNVKPDQSALKLVRVDGKYGTPNLMIDPGDPLAACKAIIAKKNELF
ncbi:MAG: hypothetical protein IPK82_33500 [Polyangiaceae bacterium]|nr:hypothetical protein [Polyangiaceae bacterium]